jgi:hypothetical protein
MLSINRPAIAATGESPGVRGGALRGPGGIAPAGGRSGRFVLPHLGQTTSPPAAVVEIKNGWPQ